MADNNLELITNLFYRVSNLIPGNQVLSTIPHDMKVKDALSLMEKFGYSQIPVVSWGEFMGVLSYRSFAKGILDIGEDLDPNEYIGDMPVEDFVENIQFVDGDDTWEAILMLLDKDDAVMVGSHLNIQGIITTMDVVSFLYQVAKPFVVIAEIELSIRRMITSCVTDEQLQACVTNSLAQLYDDEKRPTTVTQMTFNDYVQIIGDGRNWQHFKPFFGATAGTRKRTRTILEQICDIRNAVFHFKRTINEDDLRFLNIKRNWLRQKASVFEKARTQAGSEIKSSPIAAEEQLSAP